MDSYLKDLIKILGVAAAFAALPLLVGFAGLAPPWPPAVAYVTAVFILIAALVMWEWVRDVSRTVRRRFILAGIALTVIGLGVYLPFYSLYVQDVPGSDERVVRGTKCTPKAQLVYAAECPELPRDALRAAEWQAEVLWTRGSIMQVQLVLVAAWLAFTAGLIAFVGAVIAGRPTAGRPRRGVPKAAA